MPSNREIVTTAFTAWSTGTGYVTSIFADEVGASYEGVRKGGMSRDW
jgi:hypothetical protein